MHDAGALVGLDEVPGDHPPPDPAGIGRPRRQVVERAAVVHPDEQGARHGGVGRRALAEDLLHQRRGHDVGADHRVVEVGADRGAGVGQEGPGRGGPGHEGQAGQGVAPERGPQARGAVALVAQRQPDIGRLVLDLAVDVGLAEFVAAQRRAAARTVRDDLDVLVEQLLFPEALQVRPDRLHVLGGEGPVGVVDVDPVADALGERLPLAHVITHRLLAQAGELGDPHLVLDLALGRDAQLLLHLHLDGQSVGVPAGLAGDGVAPHGPVAAEEVLVDPGPDVVETRSAVGRGRALVEDPRLGSGPQLDRPLEHPVGGPPGQLLVLEGGEIGIGGDRAEHGNFLLLVRAGRTGWVVRRGSGGTGAGHRRPSVCGPDTTGGTTTRRTAGPDRVRCTSDT